MLFVVVCCVLFVDCSCLMCVVCFYLWCGVWCLRVVVVCVFARCMVLVLCGVALVVNC